MRSVLMLSSVASVAESLATPWKFACVRFFSCVRPEMRLQILQPRIGFVTSFKLEGKKNHSDLINSQVEWIMCTFICICFAYT